MEIADPTSTSRDLEDIAEPDYCVRSSAMRSKCPMETTQLIEQVRQRPCLWDRADVTYRNRLEKERAWGEVYRALNPGYDHLTRTERHEYGMIINRKWCNIRDCYKKYLNGASRLGRPYLYANQLTFLDVLYDSKDQRKRKLPEAKETAEEPDADDQEEWLNEVFVDMETPASDPQGSAKRMRTDLRAMGREGDSDENIVSILVSLIEREEDEDRAFFKSITPNVKTLSEEDKYLFRIRVLKLLNELKKKDRKLPSLKKEAPSQDSESE